MAAAVVSNGAIALGVAGVRTRGKPDKIAADDRFHIGSDTKAMTGMLCGILVDEGKLKWDQTLGNTFPELKKSMNPQYQAVTLEQLLTHRGGAPGELEKDDLWGKLWQYKGTPTSARRLLLQGVTSEAARSHSRQEVHLLERRLLHRRPHGREGHRQIVGRPHARKDFPSAGHDHRRLRGTGHARQERPTPRPQSRRLPRRARPGADNPVAIGPAGIVHCSIGEWAKFIAANLPSAKTKLVKPETLAEAPHPGPRRAEIRHGLDHRRRPTLGWRPRAHPRAAATPCGMRSPGSPRKKTSPFLVACNQANDKACNDAVLALIADHLKDERR